MTCRLYPYGAPASHNLLSTRSIPSTHARRYQEKPLGLLAFDAIAAPIDQRVVEVEEQIRILAPPHRETMLPHLICGQLRRPEPQVPERLFET